jgi:radical SAM protein with 4Fe4S-binding SPASM domain
MSPPLPAPNYEPPPELKARTSRTRTPRAGTLLQRVSLELSRRCNLECVYCYAEASPRVERGLTDAEVEAVIREAVELGACLVSFVGGGEPLLRPSLLRAGESCLDIANSLGSYALLYTNGTLLDAGAARFLFERDVSVVSKLNSLNETTQDELTAVPGSARRIRRGIDALLAAGFAEQSPSRLGLETIICRKNYDEMPELWRFMRRHNIVPEVEIATLHGRAARHRAELCFSDAEAPAKYRALFEELLRIDRSEFGFDWIPHPPFVAGSCRLFHTNCYVDDRGGVQPCAGVDISYGHLRVADHRASGSSLASVIGSAEFQKLRKVEAHLGSPCRDCELLHACYGCRGAALHQRGSLFAGDPVCWRAADRRDRG